jgi:hypothetical protein
MLRAVRSSAALALTAAVLATSPAAAQIPGPSIFTFGQAAGTPIADLYPGSGLTLSWVERFPECLESARVFAVNDATTPPNVLRVPCSPVLTANFANPQAFVALWVRSESTTSPNEIVINGRDAAGTVVFTVRLPAAVGWRPATLQQSGTPLALRSITVETLGVLHVDDLSVAQQSPQPDMRIESGPPPFTRETSATFELRGNWVGTRFRCSLDLAAFTDCSPVDALTGRATVPLTSLSERAHTFRAQAVDWYGNVAPTSVSYAWTVDATPPDTRIDDGPPARTTQRTARIAFSSPQQADAASYLCRIDSAPAPSPCSSPLTTPSLTLGDHRIEIQSVDRADNVDPTPAVRQWTVAADADADGVEDALDNCPDRANAGQADADRDGLGDACDIPPEADRDFDTVADGADNCPDRWNPDQADADGDGAGDVCDAPPAADADGDGALDASDNCPAVANADQVDADSDAIGDACDVLPPGTAAPVVGVRAQVQAVSGEVLVKVPGAADFVSFKGVATVPIGSTVDTRSGRLAITTAAGRGSGKGVARTRASVAAAIFQIRQRRVRKQRVRKQRAVATELAVRTPPGLERACGPGRVRPIKGIVRTLSGTGSGLIVTRGAASDLKVRSATWLLLDGCNGTLSQLGRGRATVRDRRLRRTVKLAAGQSYLARARLFAARQARRS